MKPFYGTMEHTGITLNTTNTDGMYYNGWYLEIDSSIYPTNSAFMHKLNIAMFRLTSFLNTLSVTSSGMKLLKVTGYNSYNTFKIEPVYPMSWSNGKPFYIIYKEDDGCPSIITK